MTPDSVIPAQIVGLTVRSPTPANTENPPCCLRLIDQFMMTTVLPTACPAEQTNFPAFQEGLDEIHDFHAVSNIRR